MTEIASMAAHSGRVRKEDDTIVNLGDLLSVYGSSIIVKPTLTVSTTAYSSGDNIGGQLALTAAMRSSGGTGVLQSVMVIDHGNQKPALDIIIFDSTATATFTDNGATPTFAATETARMIRRVSIAVSDYVTVGGTAIAEISPVSKVVAANGSANLSAAINTTSTPTFTATTDLTVCFGFLRD